ncbi:MAG: acyltransferase [Roseburia sp.]|nr:acyltransferase [Roseburia sp.]
MMETSFYSAKELEGIGFKNIGENVLISKKVSIYGAQNMSIGNHVRVDDFCVLSGELELGDYIHIAVYSALFGGKTGIIMRDFSGLSSRCVIYAESDDYSGEYLTNPTVDESYLNIRTGKVILDRHVIIGTGTSIMPGVLIGEGSAVGSMSLVNKSLEAWGIYAGIPCKKIKDRSNRLLKLEQKFMEC